MSSGQYAGTLNPPRLLCRTEVDEDSPERLPVILLAPEMPPKPEAKGGARKHCAVPNSHSAKAKAPASLGCDRPIE